MYVVIYAKTGKAITQFFSNTPLFYETIDAAEKYIKSLPGSRDYDVMEYDGPMPKNPIVNR